MTLDQIRPQPGSFRLEASGDVIYKFRKFTLDDQVWVRSTFGKNLTELIQKETDHTILSENISKISYHLLEDKSPFKSRSVKTYDDEGNEITVQIGGAKLLAAMIQPKDGLAVAEALLETIKASNPPEPEKKTVEQQPIENPQK